MNERWTDDGRRWTEIDKRTIPAFRDFIGNSRGFRRLLTARKASVKCVMTLSDTGTEISDRINIIT